MSLSKKEARGVLKQYGLRATAPRLAVLQVLEASDRPLSHSEVVDLLDGFDCDPATIFRNLVKLKEAGVSPVVSRVDGIDRYVYGPGHDSGHQHPHFSCDDCGQLTCLPMGLTNATALDGRWAKAIEDATIQFRGQCPDCV